MIRELIEWLCVRLPWRLQTVRRKHSTATMSYAWLRERLRLRRE